MPPGRWQRTVWDDAAMVLSWRRVFNPAIVLMAAGFSLAGCVPGASGGQTPTTTVTVTDTAPQVTATVTQLATDSPTPKPDPAPSAEQIDGNMTGDSHECPSDIELPEGLDRQVCGPIPDGAMKSDSAGFITASHNIACAMEEGWVGCEAKDTVMIADFHNPEGDGQCNGFWLRDESEYMCHSEPVLWDGWEADPMQWPVLPYGEALFLDDHVCTVEADGLTCWNSATGHGFLLSGSRYKHW